MQRQSEEALGLIEISDEINASIETHGVGVAKLLEEQWAPNPTPGTSNPEEDGPGSPNFLGNLFALKDGLAASAGDLKRDDQHHVHQLAGLMQVRQERQELTKEAREQYTAMRRSTEELYGAGQAFVLFGIEGPSSRKPNKLQRQMELSIPRLQDPNLELPPAKVPGIEVDPVAMARGLQALVDRMSAVQAEFRRRRRIVQETRKEKNRRLDDHRKRTVRTGRIVEGYYQLAGEEELAEDSALKLESLSNYFNWR